MVEGWLAGWLARWVCAYWWCAAQINVLFPSVNLAGSLLVCSFDHPRPAYPFPPTCVCACLCMAASLSLSLCISLSHRRSVYLYLHLHCSARTSEPFIIASHMPNTCAEGLLACASEQASAQRRQSITYLCNKQRKKQ